MWKRVADYFHQKIEQERREPAKNFTKNWYWLYVILFELIGEFLFPIVVMWITYSKFIKPGTRANTVFMNTQAWTI
jgi:hypothetical protein